MRIRLLFTPLLLVNMLASANIELNLEPEHSFKISSQSGRLEQMMQEFQQQLAAIPEARRQMMLDMLKAQGMSFDGMKGKVEVCMTAEDLKQGKLPEDHDDLGSQLVAKYADPRTQSDEPDYTQSELPSIITNSFF
jgi:hypothetical protein